MKDCSPVIGLVVLGGVCAAVWAVMTFGRGWFWRITPRLGPAEQPAAPGWQWPSVAAVVPARDEAELLPTTLASLLRQTYPGQLSVLLVDDHSEDGTGAVAASLKDAAGAAVGLRVLEAGDRPPGWTGKLWALQCGLREAADADFVLLTDADIQHPPDSLTRLVSQAQSGNYDVVSLMAKLRAVSPWERLLIPAFVYFFAMLYPFGWVNRPPVRHAAAAGGCMLVRRGVLDLAGGVGAVRQQVIDDVSLAQAMAGVGARLWLGHAAQVASIRPYRGFGELWGMVARSAFAQLRHSVLVLIGTVLGLLVVFVGPVGCLAAGLATGSGLVAGLGAAAWALMAVTYLPMQRYYGLGWWRAVTLPLAAVLYLAMTVDSARRHWLGVGVAWKGRHYGVLR